MIINLTFVNYKLTLICINLTPLGVMTLPESLLLEIYTILYQNNSDDSYEVSHDSSSD